MISRYNLDYTANLFPLYPLQDPGGGNAADNSATPGGHNNDQMTPMGMGVIGGLASSHPSSAPECGDLAELSQADLKGLVGEMTEDDEIFTSISDPTIELDNIFAEVSLDETSEVCVWWEILLAW